MAKPSLMNLLVFAPIHCGLLTKTNKNIAHGAACIYACSASPGDNYTELADQVNNEYPNTKVIGYPYGLKEEDTLTLIDDVLNAWGR